MSETEADSQPGLVRLVAGLLAQLEGTAVTECEFRAGPHHVVVRRVIAAADAGAQAVMPADDAVPASWLPIISPLTGIFYLTDAPQSPPLVSLGALVVEHQVVGLIESMKMYNPVEAEVAGVVRSILAQASAVVEKGQVLMYVEPGGEME